MILYSAFTTVLLQYDHIDGISTVMKTVTGVSIIISYNIVLNASCGVYLQNEVNVIKWDPQGNLLASGSDDMTLKVSRRIIILISRP